MVSDSCKNALAKSWWRRWSWSLKKRSPHASILWSWRGNGGADASRSIPSYPRPWWVQAPSPSDFNFWDWSWDTDCRLIYRIEGGDSYLSQLPVGSKLSVMGPSGKWLWSHRSRPRSESLDYWRWDRCSSFGPSGQTTPWARRWSWSGCRLCDQKKPSFWKKSFLRLHMSL